MKTITRRRFVQVGAGALSYVCAGLCRAELTSDRMISLFDGRSLNGWIQIENNTTAFSGASIIDPTALSHKLLSSTDRVSGYIRSRLDQQLMNTPSTYLAADQAATKELQANLAKALNVIVSGPAIFEKDRFEGITLRPGTVALLQQNPQGYQLARLNKLLLEDAYPHETARSASEGWTVKNDAMASTGSGRGVIYTAHDFSRYRLMFTMRHVSGAPDHQACVLIFCSRPRHDEKPLDALGGIQFQVPNGGHWDYRPGKNNSGGQEFTNIVKPQFDVHNWSRVEILADASAGSARMAVAQPPGNKGIEVLDFKDSSAGKVGPIAWQMHNAGLFDEYKDVMIEVNPTNNDLQLLS